MISVYGVIALTYVVIKICLSFFYSPIGDESVDGELPFTMSVVIPEYNEDPILFARCIESVLERTDILQEVWIVDDGSDDEDAWGVAKEYAESHSIINVHQFDVNKGKRHAQSYAFRHASPVDIFVTLDSDTVLTDNSIVNLVKPFTDEGVTAVTGYPRINNRDANILTRLVDMRYWVAFNVERASQSLSGSVVCCCGVLSAYRSDVVMANLDDYTTQTFLGSECTFGDDRRMTSYALQSGEVRYQNTAVAFTAAPETLSKYLTQQVRWMRSFWRESILALKWTPTQNKGLAGMMILDLSLPFLFVFLGVGDVVYRLVVGAPVLLILYLIVIFGVAYLRNIKYASRDLKVYLLSPLYAVLYVIVLLPLSFYALLTMRVNGWGTR